MNNPFGMLLPVIIIAAILVSLLIVLFVMTIHDNEIDVENDNNYWKNQIESRNCDTIEDAFVYRHYYEGEHEKYFKDNQYVYDLIDEFVMDCD